MSSLHPTRGFGLNVGKSSASNITGVQNSSVAAAAANGENGVNSPGATILDTLKKKMNQLKEDWEKSQDELEKTRHVLDEEKRRRECVIITRIIISSKTLSLFLSNRFFRAIFIKSSEIRDHFFVFFCYEPNLKKKFLKFLLNFLFFSKNV
jgi:hypothetical protein